MIEDTVLFQPDKRFVFSGSSDFEISVAVVESHPAVDHYQRQVNDVTGLGVEEALRGYPGAIILYPRCSHFFCKHI